MLTGVFVSGCIVLSQRLQVWKSPLLWLLVVLVLALPLLADFNARLAYSRQLAVEEANLNKQIAAEKAEHDKLLNLQTYVKSDAYVEHWARLARMAKPGEVPIVPVPNAANRAPHTETIKSQAANDIPSEWYAVFFGVASQNP
jgi:cell division protein FtsB